MQVIGNYAQEVGDDVQEVGYDVQEVQHLPLQVKPGNQTSTLSDLQVIEYTSKIFPLGCKHVLDNKALNFGYSLEYDSPATAAF